MIFGKVLSRSLTPGLSWWTATTQDSAAFGEEQSDSGKSRKQYPKPFLRGIVRQNRPCERSRAILAASTIFRRSGRA